MSRLVCFDLVPGRLIDIRGTRYEVEGPVLGNPSVSLKRLGSAAERVKVSRNELATLVVLEEAILIDDLDEGDADEEPDPENGYSSRMVTDLSHLRLHRIFDWFSKVFLLTRLMPVRHLSPKSPTFCGAVEEAYAELKEWRQVIRVEDGKTWSPWTLYHDLLRWRKASYKLAAVQKKGLEYTPWTKRHPLYEAAENLVEGVALDSAHLSAASVHRAVNDRLASSPHRGANRA
jgi:hypothetical protein